MSHTATGAPKLGPPSPTGNNVTFPKPVIDSIWRDIGQAHCSLGVLVDLLRGNGEPDPKGLAHFLTYIENALMESDQVISSYMAGNPGND